MQRGYGDAAMARVRNTTPPRVWRWRKAYRRGGRQALTAKSVSGRPARLTRRQRRSLATRLVKGALAHGLAGDLCTCPRIARVIVEGYGSATTSTRFRA